MVYPKRENVVFLDDSESRLKVYYCGKKEKPNKFCPVCGSSIMADLKDSSVAWQREFIAINVSEVFKIEPRYLPRLQLLDTICQRHQS